MLGLGRGGENLREAERANGAVRARVIVRGGRADTQEATAAAAARSGVGNCRRRKRERSA